MLQAAFYARQTLLDLVKAYHESTLKPSQRDGKAALFTPSASTEKVTLSSSCALRDNRLWTAIKNALRFSGIAL